MGSAAATPREARPDPVTDSLLCAGSDVTVCRTQSRAVRSERWKAVAKRPVARPRARGE